MLAELFRIDGRKGPAATYALLDFAFVRGASSGEMRDFMPKGRKLFLVHSGRTADDEMRLHMELTADLTFLPSAKVSASSAFSLSSARDKRTVVRAGCVYCRFN